MNVSALPHGGGLRTEAIAFAGFDELQRADTEAERIEIVAKIILDVFSDYYSRSRLLPVLAKQAFEQCDWQASLDLSRERISIYSLAIGKIAPLLKLFCPELEGRDMFWTGVEANYLKAISGRYQADLAYAFMNSIRRKLCQDQWKSIGYSDGDTRTGSRAGVRGLLRRLEVGDAVTVTLAKQILIIPGFDAAYRDLDRDAARIAERINATRRGRDGDDGPAISSIEMVDAGFYRNRGAYLVGRVNLADGGWAPLAIALLNEDRGIYADAVLLESDELQYVFSSTLANFHVTSEFYHELAEFLHSLMRKRPLGLHYSTIGFNHVGKIAVRRELETELARNGEVFARAVGHPGTVAIGFSAPSSAFVLKVIRDRPTKNYKWGVFEGVDAVLQKYKRVHEINRTGSMLDNVIYYNTTLPRSFFGEEILAELLNEAGGMVALQDDEIVFKNLIVQMKMIPLTNFLETATDEDATKVIVNLGHSIKNNAAANIFNKDLDGRNYGVSPIRKVYLFDYDALERLTEVKIRSNLERMDGEEDVPDWFFEDGVIFLPEEIEAGLLLENRSLRRHFRRVHGDLLTTDYWQGVQRALREGRVPRTSTYPDERRLGDHG